MHSYWHKTFTGWTGWWRRVPLAMRVLCDHSLGVYGEPKVLFLKLNNPG
jgi:hypothetical protein